MSSEMVNPVVSIVVAYLNEQRFIGDAVASVAEQTYRPVELVLVDDGSTDDSQKVILAVELGDVMVVHRRHDQSCGLSAARNTGLLASSGEYITYLDGDDIIAPGRLTQMMLALQTNTEIDVLIGQDELLVEPEAEVPKDVLGGRVNGRAFYMPSMLYHRRVHRIVGGFDIRFELCEDVDWLNRAVALGLKVEMCEVLAIKRRIHGSNLSYQTERLKSFRLKSLYEVNIRRRKGISHYVDPTAGIPR